MKTFTGLAILCLAGIQLVQSATLDLSAGTATVTEGTDSTISVVCTLNPLTALTRDAVCGLGVETGIATPAENGWDVGDVTGYSCTILAGQTSGSVDIPLVDDVVIDNAEEFGITCTASTGDTAGTTASFTINDGGATDAQLTIVPRATYYKVSESGTNVEIVVDAIDSNGNVAPNEETLNIQLVFPTQVSDDTAATTDYDSAVAAIAATGSIDGVATSSYTLSLPVTSDTTPENLETINVLLSDSAAVASVTSDATSTITVHILDDDKPELVVVRRWDPVPRRAKYDFTLRAFNAIGTWDSLVWSYLPFTLKDYAERDITTTNGIVVRETTLARPQYKSRTRFNEYKYTTTQTINTIAYDLETYAYVSATSHTRSRAPIEAWDGPTKTVWPTAVDASGNCVSIPSDTISVPNCSPRYTRSLRWWFIKDGDTAADIQRLTRYNGKTWIPISECSDEGLYIVSRRGRGRRGWIDFVRVIISACPAGFITPPACTTPAPDCLNGGIVDPVLGLCTCPPGFVGTNCETAVVDEGDFGSSCQFSISDILPGNRRGRCVLYSLPVPFGVTCAAGFYGRGCCNSCPVGFFGANCNSECHCIDEVCDKYSGKCPNGCAPFYFGTNCQSGGPP